MKERCGSLLQWITEQTDSGEAMRPSSFYPEAQNPKAKMGNSYNVRFSLNLHVTILNVG